MLSTSWNKVKIIKVIMMEEISWIMDQDMERGLQKSGCCIMIKWNLSLIFLGFQNKPYNKYDFYISTIFINKIIYVGWFQYIKA